MAARLRALLLGAGIGSRLRPLTDVLPKCLMPVNGRPLLEYWLRLLVDAGVTEIVLNLHHHAALVREYVQRGPFARYITLSPEKDLLGTGGTLLHNRARLEGAPVLFAHADNLSHFDVARFLETHRSRPKPSAMTMMTFVTDAPECCGIVALNAQGLVTAFHEKSPNPPGNLANGAVYIVESPVFAFLESLRKPAIDFSTEVIPHFLGRIYAFHNDIYHRDIGTLSSLARAQLEFPTALAARAVMAAKDDPWHGMMQANGGQLAREFSRCTKKAFGPEGAGQSSKSSI